MKMRKRQQTRKGKKLVYEVGNEYYGMELTRKERYACGQTKLTFLRPCGHLITAHDGPSVLRQTAAAQCAECRRQGSSKRKRQASFWNRTGRFLSTKQRERVIQMLRDGVSCSEIAHEAKLNRSSVRTIKLVFEKRSINAQTALTATATAVATQQRPAKLSKREQRLMNISKRFEQWKVEYAELKQRHEAERATLAKQQANEQRGLDIEIVRLRAELHDAGKKVGQEKIA